MTQVPSVNTPLNNSFISGSGFWIAPDARISLLLPALEPGRDQRGKLLLLLLGIGRAVRLHLMHTFLLECTQCTCELLKLLLL
jgi:hypothetical protein